MKWLWIVVLSISGARGAEISLYAINSPHELNWETPRSLLLTTMRSSVNPIRQGRSNHTIGHAYIGFKCDGAEEVLSGMTSGKGFSSRNNLFNEKHGLSVILQDNPGRFETHERVKRDIEFYSSQPNRMSVLKVIVDNDRCLKVRAWYEEYSSRPVHIYGGVGRRPLRGEGAGCTAYVMSYFEYADVNYDYFNHLFEQTIYIPEELLGGEFGNREVPLRDIMGNTQKLSIKADNTLEVKLYDANTMYNWIVKNWQTKSLEGFDVQSEKLNKIKMLVLRQK